MAEQPDRIVQSIIDSNRKHPKRAEDKAAAIGLAVAFGAFQIVAALGIVHFPPSNGINIYRLAGAALCGAIGAAIGAAIGKWAGRPRRGR